MAGLIQPLMGMGICTGLVIVMGSHVCVYEHVHVYMYMCMCTGIYIRIGMYRGHEHMCMCIGMGRLAGMQGGG